MQTLLCEMLQCPVCGGRLDWQIGEQTNEDIEQGEARCTACLASYPVREGVGVFL